MSEGTSHDAPAAGEPDSTVARFIREALQGMQFGTVTVIVQDGVVIQIDRTEKRRLPRRQ